MRRRLDIEAGDELRWDTEEGNLTVGIVRQRYDAFADDDFDAADDSLDSRRRLIRSNSQTG